MKPKGINQKTVNGILIPDKWDDKNNVTGVSIQTFDENEYIVQSCLDDKKLFEFIMEKVKVTGEVIERFDGKFDIKVNHFERIDN